MESQKVLILTHVYPDEHKFLGGIFIHNQAKALKRAGLDIKVVFLDYRSIRKKRKWFFSQYQLDGIDVMRYAIPCGPIQSILNCLDDMLLPFVSHSILKKFGKPNLIHAHFYDVGLLADKLSKRFQIPYVITEHSSGIFQESLPEKELEKAAKVYVSADAVIAVGKALGQRLNMMGRMKVEIVPNILPEYMFEKIESKKDADHFYFVSIGNLIQSKRFDLTIKSFSLMIRKHRDVRLKLIGEGPLENTLKELVEQLELTNYIEFLGKLDNKKLVALYRNSDCFVLPSDFETFGVVYTEAMACGLPVIATRCGGPEDFVNPQNGILVPTNDIEALFEAMETIYINRMQYRCEELSDFAYQKFSEKSVVNQIMSIYENIKR